ncbi:MAG: porin [Burkholderiales bacterium]|nr:porin [Burkholderiales bacterium]
MKKSLLALAVLGAFATGAQAQTNVSIGGVVQANWKSYSIGSQNAGRATQTEYRVDDDYTSRFWLTGTEALGGGLSALFYIENRLNTTDSSAVGVGNGLGNGDTFLGLKGSWGQVTVGKHSMMSTSGLITEILAAKGVTAMPTSMFGTYILNQNNGYLDITRRANSIYYKSPVMSGFNVNVGVSTNSAGNEGVAPGTMYNDGREWFLQGGYNNGPLSVNLAYRNNTVEGRTGTDDKQFRLYGFYKLPMGLKIGLQIDRSTRDTVAAGASTASYSRTAWQLPISYVFGNNAILFSYTKAGDRSGVANSGAKMWVLGWDYALSARTNVGVFYSKLSNDTAGTYQPFLAGTSATGSGLLAGESAQTFGLGLKHTF